MRIESGAERLFGRCRDAAPLQYRPDDSRAVSDPPTASHAQAAVLFTEQYWVSGFRDHLPTNNINDRKASVAIFKTVQQYNNKLDHPGTLQTVVARTVQWIYTADQVIDISGNYLISWAGWPDLPSQWRLGEGRPDVECCHIVAWGEINCSCLLSADCCYQ